MRHEEGCELKTCECEDGRLSVLEEEARTFLELCRTKFGDTLTRYDPPLSLATVFKVAADRNYGIVGFEFTARNGEKCLVGHVNPSGALEEGRPTAAGAVVLGRKVWLG